MLLNSHMHDFDDMMTH